ncbi:MAG: DUF971 domain-containing protein [Deltaproteobacteria bacterium]|nr:DUF971 domain-containing protein [Deltaproteobacteria bacterium]
MSAEFSATDIHVDNDAGNMQIEWEDGHKSVLPFKLIRSYCPCAECQGHGGGPLQVIENKVTGVFGADLVGQYAINLQFSDGHSTGIFRWELLRKLDPTEEDRWGDPATACLDV